MQNLKLRLLILCCWLATGQALGYPMRSMNHFDKSRPSTAAKTISGNLEVNAFVEWMIPTAVDTTIDCGNIDDDNACTVDACDPGTGATSHTPISPDDNNLCTTDGCDNVTGVYNTPVSTDDGDACTNDGCDPITGMYNTTVSTDDSDACTDDGCDPTTGVYNNDVTVDDSDACTTDGCDLSTGVYHNPINTDDGVSCTTDACDPETGEITHDSTDCIIGCRDQNACNYDYNVTINDTTYCDYSCKGCMDAVACNYKASATMDDGSCVFETLEAICKNVVRRLQNDGTLTVEASEFDNGSTGCGPLEYAISRTDFDCASLDGAESKDFEITLTVTDKFGDTDECTATLTVNSSVQVNISSDYSKYCLNEHMIFNANVSGGQETYQYVWSRSGASWSEENGNFSESYELLANQVTSGTVLVTVTDANGCKGKDDMSVTVCHRPQVTIQGAMPICPQDATNACPFNRTREGITLTANVHGGCNKDDLYVEWSTGSTEFSIQVTEPGDYYVTVTDPETYCEDYDHVTIVEDNSTSVSLVVNAPTVPPGNCVQIDAIAGDINGCFNVQSSTGEPVTILSISSHEIFITACPSITTTYTVGFTDDCGNTASETVTIVVLACEIPGNGNDDDNDGIIDEYEDWDYDGWTACNGDCNDYNSNVYPGAYDYCDGTDNDCDGSTDEDGNCGIYGCTDPSACNYNSSATQDDGSCYYGCGTYGCTNSSACNYDPNANYDDGSCEYSSCYGCTDPSACNYNPSATQNDGSCYYGCVTYGCTDPSACNYNPSATQNDGSCINCDDGNPCTYDYCDEYGNCQHTHSDVMVAFNATTNTCNGNVSFSGQSLGFAGIQSWFWDFGDGYYAYEQYPTHQYAYADDFNVCLSVYGYDWCGNYYSLQSCQTVSVAMGCDDGSACTYDWCDGNGNCQHSPINYEWLYTGFNWSQNGCPTNYSFSDQSSGYCYIQSWYWSFGDGNYSTEQNPTHAYATSGEYTVCLTISTSDGFGTWHETQSCQNITVSVSCDDGNACTYDWCDGSGCHNDYVNADDNDACTDDYCDATNGTVYHNPVNADDGNACTEDGCEPWSGVYHYPVNTDDYDACTEDGCDMLTGVYHNAYIVNDNNPCTHDSCNPSTGYLYYTPVDVDDSNICTQDGCSPTTGIYHNPTIVDDNDACTDDYCDAATGAESHISVIINDGDPCTDDGCESWSGVYHYPTYIDDGDICTDDFCNAGTGEITHTAVNIDDSDACTEDGCNTEIGIYHYTFDTDDSNACTTDGCDPISGVYHIDLIVNDYDACTSDYCEPSTGFLYYTPVDVEDYDACTNDYCDVINGVYHNGINPDDSNACTDDGCEPSNGVYHTPVNSDDYNACTDDYCDVLNGVYHTTISPDDGNVCTEDYCDPSSGVYHLAITVDDNNNCTSDYCDPSSGPTYTPINVDDNNICTDDYCEPWGGVYHTPVNTDDYNACTEDGCNSVTGVYHNAVNVDDNNVCTHDYCDPSTGALNYVPVEDVDDYNYCTEDGCHPLTGIYHHAINVNDNNVCTYDYCDASTGAIYYVPVDADDQNNCTIDDCNPVTGVYHTPIFPPVANIAASGPTTFCTGGSVKLTCSAPGTTSYQWKRNGNNINGHSSMYTATQTGTYTCYAANTCGNSISTGIYVHVGKPTAVSIAANGPTAICQGSTVTLTCTATAGTTFTWKRGNLVVQTGANNTYNAANAGSYTCTALNTCGATISTAITVTVATTPTGVSITAAGPLSVCNGGSVALTCTATNANTYQWVKNEIPIPGATNPTYSATQTGAYACIATNTCGSSISNPLAFAVQVPVPSAVITANANTFCGSLILTCTAANATAYQWQKLNTTWGNVAGATAKTYNATALGKYRCVASNACNSRTSVFYQILAPSVTLTKTGTVCNGSTILTAHLTNGTAATGNAYKWYKGATLLATTAVPTYAPLSAGNYKVSVTFDAGCAKVSAVLAVACAAAPLTRDTDRTEAQLETETETEERDTQGKAAGNAPISLNLVVSPNPSQGLFHVRLMDATKGQSCQISVFDNMGRECCFQRLQNDAGEMNTDIDLSDKPSGVYFMKIQTAESVKSIRLVKE